MVTICLQCGDKGFSNAFVYCVNCLNFAVHRYCLDKLPATFDEFVHWVCEDCEEKVPKQSTLHKLSSILTQKRDKRSPTHVQKTHGRKKLKRDSTCLTAETEEHRCEGGPSQQLCVVNTQQDLIKDVLVGDCSPINEETRSTPSCITKQEKDLELEKEIILKLDSGANFDDETHLATDPNNIQHDHHEHAQPVIDPIWRGNFSIHNEKYDTIDGFVAHLSTKACTKVYEAASLFPSLLLLEMLPKSDVWPKSFQRSEPSDDNIALYFFPEDKRYERVFDHLVEDLICRELAMRAKLKNAELLIFTSIELPLLHWRIQGKYYLWGVFRGKQGSQSHSLSSGPLVLNVSNGCAMYPDSASGVGPGEKRNLSKTKITGARSPLSPLSNSGEHELDQESEDR